MDARTWGRWWRLVGRHELINTLRLEWDPIGLGDDLPADEYESVTGPLASLLRHDAPTVQIAQTLSVHRTVQFGSQPDLVADRRAAGALRAWYSAAQAHAETDVVDER